MDPLFISVFSIILSLGLLNVWLLRAHRPTAFRGGAAATLREEFATYGLPPYMFYTVGALKVGAALTLLLGFWLPSVVAPAAGLIAILMAGAVFMHFKVCDPLVKALPAASMLIMSVVVCVCAL